MYGAFDFKKKEKEEEEEEEEKASFTCTHKSHFQ
jgi:hypothetical protein